MKCKNLICPICSAPLFDAGGALRCESGHSFDVAKEGYVNLLPPDKKKSAEPGDNKIMVSARRDFLSKGYFEPLSTALSRALPPSCEEVIDCGCGTGYYGSNIRRSVDNNLFISGVDISKFAVRLAAKAGYDEAAVASVYALPFKDESFDAGLTVFAPLCEREMYRVLKPRGMLLRVTPGEDHLFELKRAVYGDKTYKNPPENAKKQLVSSDGTLLFKMERGERVTFTKELTSNEDVTALFSMTPYEYKTSPEQKQRLQALSTLSVTFDFIITAYVKP